MRALSLLALHAVVAAFDYKSISVNAPRRIVTQDDIDAKFEEVDKPYALYPVDGPAEEGLCVPSLCGNQPSLSTAGRLNFDFHRSSRRFR